MNKLNRERKFSGMALFLMLLALASSGSQSFAQTVVYTKDNMHELPTTVTSTSRISELKYETKLVGSNYLDEAWQPSDISLLGDSIELQGIDSRMDISNGVLELLVEGDQPGQKAIKIIPSYKVKSVSFPARKDLFLSRSGLNMPGPDGFYRVLFKKRLALYCHYSTKILEANYNVALDAGRRDDEIVLVGTYYLVKGGKLIKLESNKNKLIEQLGGEKVKDYIKENSIDLKEEEGLVEVVKFLDGKK